MAALLWVFAAAGALAGAAVLIIGLQSANGAPQEAAAAAIACALAVVPYVFARSCGEIFPRSAPPTPLEKLVASIALLAIAGFGIVFAGSVLTDGGDLLRRQLADVTSDSPTVPPAPPASAPPAATGGSEEEYAKLLAELMNWQVSVSASPVDDTRTVIIARRSTDSLSGRFSAETPSLVLRCRSNETDVYITSGLMLESGYGDYDRTAVRYRFDTDPPKSARLLLSTDREAAFFNNAIPTIRQMLTHKELTVELTPSDRGPQPARFNLEGLSEHIGPLQEACSWK